MDDAQNMAGYPEIWDEHRLRVATEAAGVSLFSWNVETDRITMDKRAFDTWGLPHKTEITFEELSACIHPADLDKVRAAFAATREMKGPYEIDFRILHSGGVRWISARGRGDDQGIVGKIMFGVFLDVTFRKKAEEDRDLLTQEMHHRIMNLFTLASSLTSIAFRSAQTKDAMFEDLTRRLRGLAAAHNLIMPGFHEQKQAVALTELLLALLQAYRTDALGRQNVSVANCAVMVGERSITSIAMLVHELATNSAKYGALSSEAGELDVEFHEAEETVDVVWNERGVMVRETATPSGFGHQMMDRVIQQVNGSITRTWSDAGLVVTLCFSKASLGA